MIFISSFYKFFSSNSCVSSYIFSFELRSLGSRSPLVESLGSYNSPSSDSPYGLVKCIKRIGYPSTI